jgi:hypothetical protein
MKTKATMTAWHYTVGRHLDPILQSGVLLPADAGLAPGERPAVWFSLRQDWEPTAAKFGIIPQRKSCRGAMARVAQLGGGLVRIGVELEAAPHDWRAFRELSGIDPTMARGLAIEAKSQGADPYLWRVSFDPVTAAAWVALQRWDGAAWVAAADHRSARGKVA